MKKTINYFCRMLCALLLCVDLVVVGCSEGPLGENEKTEQGNGENGGNGNQPGGGSDDDGSNDEGGENGGGEGDNGESDGNAGTSGAMTWSLDAVTEVSATFSGKLAVVAADLSFSKVTVYYSDAEVFNINDASQVSTTTFDADQKFAITVTGLKPNVKYNYCLIAEVKSEKTYGDVKNFTTIPLVAPTLNDASEITYSDAVISGKIYFPSEIVSDLVYGFEYCSSQDFASDAEWVNVIDLDSKNNFRSEISSLIDLTTYYYRSYITMSGVEVLGETKSFTTQPHPYNIQSDLNLSWATDLSLSGSANSYIVSKAGAYKFKAVKGNSNMSLGSAVSASILWETFGTDTAPEMLDLISAICYKDNYIAFQTAETFKEGNAVIAVKDAEGNILWSWHIWLTDQPAEQVYYNNASTMMDRNLGATSATPGDVGALGLLYQWGRKDPFLGSSSITDEILANSTVTWPSPLSANYSGNGTIEYAVSHPTTFITGNEYSEDWYYTGSPSVDNTRWTTSDSSKSIYDPCPAGWRVPDGGEDGAWSKALDWPSYSGGPSLYDSTNEGMNFSGIFGNDLSIWYPISGFRSYLDGSLCSVGFYGLYWSASPDGLGAYSLGFNSDGYVYPSDHIYRAYGCSVRCVRE